MVSDYPAFEPRTWPVRPNSHRFKCKLPEPETPNVVDVMPMSLRGSAHPPLVAAKGPDVRPTAGRSSSARLASGRSPKNRRSPGRRVGSARPAAINSSPRRHRAPHPALDPAPVPSPYAAMHKGAAVARAASARNYRCLSGGRTSPARRPVSAAVGWAGPPDAARATAPPSRATQFDRVLTMDPTKPRLARPATASSHILTPANSMFRLRAASARDSGSRAASAAAPFYANYSRHEMEVYALREAEECGAVTPAHPAESAKPVSSTRFPSSPGSAPRGDGGAKEACARLRPRPYSSGGAFAARKELLFDWDAAVAQVKVDHANCNYSKAAGFATAKTLRPQLARAHSQLPVDGRKKPSSKHLSNSRQDFERVKGKRGDRQQTGKQRARMATMVPGSLPLSTSPLYPWASPYEQLRTLQRNETMVSTLCKHPYTSLEEEEEYS